jgi:hypothetical protein
LFLTHVDVVVDQDSSVSHGRGSGSIVGPRSDNIVNFRRLGRGGVGGEERRAYAEQQASGYPALVTPVPQAVAEEDLVGKLRKLGALSESGALSDEGFAPAKLQLLS